MVRKTLLWQKKNMYKRHFLCLLHRNLLRQKSEPLFRLGAAFAWSAAGGMAP